jgi:hypothetical protein
VNVTNINYVNRENVTVVSQADFAGARPVAGAAIRMSPAQLQSAHVMGANPEIVPVRNSVAIGAPRVAPMVSARPVIAHATPPPAPVSFAARQQVLAQNKGVPLNNSQVAQLRTQQPSAVVAGPAVHAIGSAMPTGANRPAASVPAAGNPAPADRMNSRPPGAAPLPAGAQTRPMQPASTTTTTTPQRTTTTPAATTATTPATSSRPAGKQTKAPPKGKSEEKDEKR